MAVKLTDKDYTNLDKSVGAILDAYTSVEVTKAQAIGAIAHIIAAAAKDNESEVKSWGTPATIARWKETAIAHRP